jgi:hypothetical protein
MDHETIELEHATIEIHRDDDPADPRREHDNVGTMVCFHSRYRLGDDHEFTPESAREFIEEQGDNILWLPLYLYDHSGITISTAPFSCPWDSGQIGFIYCTQKQINHEWNGDRDAARKYLFGEVSTYDQYLTGDIWGFVVKDEHEEIVDSCWGFYGYEYCVSEARDSAQHCLEVAHAF